VKFLKPKLKNPGRARTALPGFVGSSHLRIHVIRSWEEYPRCPRIPCAARLVRLLDRVEAEPELGARHLLGGVLVSTLEPGQTAHTHDEQVVALAEVHDRRLGGDLHVDAVALAHHPDGEGMGRVQAGLDTLLDHRLGLVGGEVAPPDRGLARGEHVVCNAEAEERTHVCLL